MNILLIEPYFTGSHASWAEGYAAHSAHEVKILSMEGRFWKWRMHGGAVTLAGRYMKDSFSPGLIMATDMLDLSTFLALTRSKTAAIPTALYFHENQLSYPWSPDDRDVEKKRDGHYGFINYSSALSADAVLFNSGYHMSSFLEELESFLKNFPEYNELDTIEKICAKSSVLPLGIDLERFDDICQEDLTEEKKPLILWNHRWEYDKNPEDFFRALYILADRNIDFEIAILGENFRIIPEEFNKARKRLGERIIHFGYADNFSDYARWLHRADIIPVTSNHDFFGASVVEAMNCNCFPILPKRLAYPEHIPEDFHHLYFYDTFEELLERLDSAITGIDRIREADISHFVSKYDWHKLAPAYDEMLENIILKR